MKVEAIIPPPPPVEIVITLDLSQSYQLKNLLHRYAINRDMNDLYDALGQELEKCAGVR